MTPFALSAAHALVLVLLLVLGALVAVHALRGRIVETLATAGEAALLWHLGRMLAHDAGDARIAIVSYAPFIGITIGFVLMTIGHLVYDGLIGSRLFDRLPAGPRRALDWLYAPDRASPAP